MKAKRLNTGTGRTYTRTISANISSAPESAASAAGSYASIAENLTAANAAGAERKKNKEGEMYLNWNWFRSLIDDFRNGKMQRERFIREWRDAQETLRALGRKNR